MLKWYVALGAVASAGSLLAQTSSAPCGPDAPIVYHGSTYALVDIGTRCAFAADLATQFYRNGEPIASGADPGGWPAAVQGLYVPALLDEDAPPPALPAGHLYNAHAVLDGRGLCPAGFHVGTEADFDAAFQGSHLAGPTGYISSTDGRHYDIASFTGWWTSTAAGSGLTHLYIEESAELQLGRYALDDLRAGFAVRCFRD